jgi:hypothetical protein
MNRYIKSYLYRVSKYRVFERYHSPPYKHYIRQLHITSSSEFSILALQQQNLFHTASNRLTNCTTVFTFFHIATGNYCCRLSLRWRPQSKTLLTSMYRKENYDRVVSHTQQPARTKILPCTFQAIRAHMRC